MKLKAIVARLLCQPVIGAALTVLCGIILWTPVGEAWENVSYDYLFRFGAPTPTNKLALILLDNAADAHFNADRFKPLEWKRTWHAELLDRLAKDRCPLVVMDVFLKSGRDTNEDLALAQAIKRQGHVFLTAREDNPSFPGVNAQERRLPYQPFLEAAAGYGVGKVNDLDRIVRRHWPFPASEAGHSLAWEAARFAGAHLPSNPQEQWIRYYSGDQAWQALSYHLAALQPDGYYRGKIVFIGSDPKTTRLGDEPDHDEFGTPYTRWTRESVGGVKIIATMFLNLMNGDWLRRPPWWAEVLVLLCTGSALGAGLCRVGLQKGCGPGKRLGSAALVALAAALAVMSCAAAVSYVSNLWFPWLIISGGQVPLALAWVVACAFASRTVVEPAPELLSNASTEYDCPQVHGYEYLSDEPFGQGGFGKVWLVRSVIGEVEALKAVSQHYLGEDWYGEAEFKAIQKYKPISNNHPGLLHILHVDVHKRSNAAGYLYYVMELGDSLVPDWEKDPSGYKPRNLASLRAQVTGQRLPVRECVEIMLPLAEALEFLHGQGLTHRDIKPENIIFVRGRPKLADVGLVTDIRVSEQTRSRPGTPGYMLPPPEPVGTVAGHIYALGMVLYVISTGRKPDLFPIVATTLAEGPRHGDFMLLNSVITKACQPDPAARFQSAAEIHAALVRIQASLRLEVAAQA